MVSLQPNGGPRWFSPPEGLSGVTAAQTGIQNFKAEGFYGVTAAQAGIQKSEVIGENWIPACAGMTRNPGFLLAQAVTRYTIRLKCYTFSVMESSEDSFLVTVHGLVRKRKKENDISSLRNGSSICFLGFLFFVSILAFSLCPLCLEW